MEAAIAPPLLDALREAGCRLHSVTPSILRLLAQTATPQGLVAVVRRREWALDELLREPQPFLVVLDGVQEPGNVGTIMRAAWGAGVQGVVFLPGTADPYQGKAVRASAGALFRVPHLWAPDAEELLSRLQGAGLPLWVAEASAGEPPDGVDLTGPGALILGSEAAGPSPAARRLARPLTIPMVGGSESLNVAMAASILLYERTRQLGRRAPGE